MFDRLFRRAERKIDSVVSKYVRRAIVAVPLLIAAVFATAAISAKMVELYGPIYGHAIMAAGFVALSGLIALFALTGTQSTPVEEANAAKSESAEAIKDDDDRPLVPPELLSLITAAAPVALPGVARVVARNLPVLLVLAVLGYLFTRFAGRSSPQDAADDAAEAAGDAAASASQSAASASAASAEAHAAQATASMAARAAAA
jgi:Na+-transporting methylmalonyl-CoA/oxaloacetate decarboxylase gamma subunit